MNKQLVKQRFSRSLKTYSACAVVQKQMAKNLAGMIEGTEYRNILEIGCGTGFVTEIINKKINYFRYDAVDIVSECESYIKSISPEINFINADVETFIPDKKYNLIISNAALQWLEDLPAFISRINKTLAPDGIFALTLFGKEHFKELNFLQNPGLHYYTVSELNHICSEYKILNIKTEIITLDFNNPREVLYHIKNTGVNALEEEKWTKSNLVDFETKYSNRCKDGIKLTYNPAYILLKQS